MNNIRIATRQSKLALWQANFVAKQLKQHYPKLDVELVPILSSGDKVQDKPLADIGGKGLFIKELESALLTGHADIAVHSMKDVPPDLPEGLQLAAMLMREDPRDAFVSQTYTTFADLPLNAIVGTCSPRRAAQLLSRRPDLAIKSLRGNVGTRLKKLDQGEFDAIILAAAGLKRLGLENVVSEYFATDFMLPAVAQGVIGIECLSAASDVITCVNVLNDAATAACVNVERDLVRALNGNCHSPIGSYACLQGENICLYGLVQTVKGEIITAQHTTTLHNANSLGEELAAQLLTKNIII